MAGPLGVTHLLLFGRSENGNVNLRILKTPRGPTLHFKVMSYSLCKDVIKGQRHPRGETGKEYLIPPLLVMNHMISQTDGKSANHEVLTQTMFQSIFPILSAQRTDLKSVKRVVLVNRGLPEPDQLKEDEDYILDLRHFAVTTRPTGVPRAVRRLNRAAQPGGGKSKGRSAIPDLGRLEDISEYMLDPAAAGGYTSESEVDTDAEVEVTLPQTQRVSKPAKQSKLPEPSSATEYAEKEKKVVKLHELGPRLRLQLVKIDEGVNDGKILWHRFVKKSRDEERRLDVKSKERQKLKEHRKKEQEDNVKRKIKEKEDKKAVNGKDGAEGEDSELDKITGWSGDEDIWSDEEVQDTGSELDSDLEAEGGHVSNGSKEKKPDLDDDEDGMDED